MSSHIQAKGLGRQMVVRESLASASLWKPERVVTVDIEGVLSIYPICYCWLVTFGRCVVLVQRDVAGLRDRSGERELHIQLSFSVALGLVGCDDR